MKLTRYQNDEERTILTGLIVHDRILARVVAKVKTEQPPFRSKWANLIFKWCAAFFVRYQKAPRKSIQSLFRHYAEKIQDEDVVAIIEKFLAGLSDDYKGAAREMNEDFLVDMAAKYFNRVRCEKETEEVQAELLKGDVESAVRRMSSFTSVDLATTAVVKVFNDKDAFKDVLYGVENEVLIQYPGIVGEFFAHHLQRDGFISFLAPEKRGKSFILLDIAWRAAVNNRRRTLLYSVGDMSQRQMMRRLTVRAARRPIESTSIQVPKRVRVVDGVPDVRWREESYAERISLKEVGRAVKRIKIKTAHSSSLLRMRCTSVSSTRVMDIRADIDEMVREGWVPEVLVLDYADILAPERILGDGDVRHQTDETWKALRKLSQDYHMLVVTATQSNAASYESKVIRRSHFSEDKRKLAHVTGMVGINQTEEEKNRGIFRLNWVLLREGFYSESKCVTVAGCLAIANPMMISCW